MARRKAVEKRLLSLASGELAAAAIFFAVFYSSRSRWGLGTGSILSFTLLELLLLQGAIYWFLRYRSLTRRHPIHAGAVWMFSILNRLAQVLFIVVLVAVVVVAEGTKDMLVALTLWLFAVLEYINYYVYRLSYGSSGFNIRRLVREGLRESSLRRMLSD